MLMCLQKIPCRISQRVHREFVMVLKGLMQSMIILYDLRDTLINIFIWLDLEFYLNHCVLGNNAATTRAITANRIIILVRLENTTLPRFNLLSKVR